MENITRNDTELLKPYNIIEKYEDTVNKSQKPITIIADMDDTICNTTEVYMSFLLNNKELFNKYIDLDRTINTSILNGRKEYLICDWLKRDNIEIPDNVKDIFTSLWSKSNFFKFVKPTKYGEMLSQIVNKNCVKELYIVSHCISKNQADQKVDWLSNFFNGCSKIKFIKVYDGTKKSTAVNEYKISWDTFADDVLDNVYDMVKYSQGFGNEIIIPKMGYNEPDARFSKFVNTYNLQTFYIKSE
jgi:hypothetical protein